MARNARGIGYWAVAFLAAVMVLFGTRDNVGQHQEIWRFQTGDLPEGDEAFGNLNTSEVVWDRPFGSARQNGPFGIPTMLPIDIGAPNNAGGFIAASSLFIIADATDSILRAVQVEMPAGGQATPMTYEAGGRQIVDMNAGNRDFMTPPIGDYFIA